jgi:hypothetical protein
VQEHDSTQVQAKGYRHRTRYRHRTCYWLMQGIGTEGSAQAQDKAEAKDRVHALAQSIDTRDSTVTCYGKGTRQALEHSTSNLRSIRMYT